MGHVTPAAKGLLQKISSLRASISRGGGGGGSHMEQKGMLDGNFEFDPQKEDHLGVAQAFATPIGGVA